MKKSSIIEILITLSLVICFFILIVMRDTLSRQLFISGMFILVDIYVLIAFLSLVSDQRSKWLLAAAYIIISLYGYYGMFVAFERWRTDPGLASPLHNFTIGFAFTLLVSKFVLVLGLVIQDIGRLIYGTGQSMAGLFIDVSSENGFPQRRNFLTTAAATIAAVPFFSMLYGITFGKYNYTVEHLKLRFKDLPKAFKGLKVVQISDAHAGSWDSVDKVQQGITKINELKPDIVVFTGDLVNGNKNEIDPFINVFAAIEAPMGKYAVLGNHDYYGTPRDPNQEEAYWADFLNKYKKMGFDLILNENRAITKDGEQIKLIGVENWGAGRWFPKKGDLDKACEGCGENDFAILLSHDPTHFDEHVVDHSQKIHLTLSGHTHGMQFGVKFKNFKWSPVQYRYKKWMGLYEVKDQFLYVNRGFGFLGFPGRVGMWPEITCIELNT
ncbi:MAG: metallophosphoesterase [Saprospiraceae bacterium]|nr:metallophosphoesterase [Saprospiraceae bacterium]|tara:strand:+ start:3568 stop:4887 length:1320 start_codon:yes stop_codon:yes gene_type:complete